MHAVIQTRMQTFSMIDSCRELNEIRRVFLRCFRNPIRVPRIENRVPRIENRVPRIRENYHRVPRTRENRVPRIREIGSLQVHTGYLTFSLKKTWNMQSKSTTARSAADHYCATTRTNWLHPPRLKLNRTGGSRHWRRMYETQLIRSTKSDQLNTRIRCGYNKQSEATRSIFARLCSSVGVS